MTEPRRPQRCGARPPRSWGLKRDAPAALTMTQGERYFLEDAGGIPSPRPPALVSHDVEMARQERARPERLPPSRRRLAVSGGDEVIEPINAAVRGISAADSDHAPRGARAGRH